MNWLHPDYLWLLAAAPLVVGLFVWAALRRRAAARHLEDKRVCELLAPALPDDPEWAE